MGDRLAKVSCDGSSHCSDRTGGDECAGGHRSDAVGYFSGDDSFDGRDRDDEGVRLRDGAISKPK